MNRVQRLNRGWIENKTILIKPDGNVLTEAQWTLYFSCTFVLGHHLAATFPDGIKFDFLKDLGFELI